MTKTERIIIWPIGIVLLILAVAVYLAWCGAMSIAAFWDWAREDI